MTARTHPHKVILATPGLVFSPAFFFYDELSRDVQRIKDQRRPINDPNIICSYFEMGGSAT